MSNSFSERTIKGTFNREMCQREFMSAELFDVLFKKLDQKGSLSTCSLVLPTLRVILESNFYCKSQFTRIYLARLQQVLTRVLKHDQPETLGLVLDNLLYILFESDDLSKPKHFLMYPEIAPLVLDLLQHFPDVSVPGFYVGVFRRLAEESTENQVVLAHHGCIRPLLSLLAVVSDADFRQSVFNLVSTLCLQYVSPVDLRAVLCWLGKDSQTGQMSTEGLNLVATLALGCRRALETISDRKRPAPRSFFSFSGKEAALQVTAVRGNPLILPGKGFTVIAWIRPIQNPEAIFLNVFTLTERSCTVLLNVTASGALQLIMWDGERQPFECVSESDKLGFGQWNLVSFVCSQKYAKKDDFVLYINETDAVRGEIRPSRIPKEMYSRLSIGGNSTGDAYSGQISTFYLFSTAVSDEQVALFYRLGPDYEGFFLSEESSSLRQREIGRLVELRLALSLCVSPRYANLRGRVLDAAPILQTAFEPYGQKRQPRVFEDTNAVRVTANRAPDSINLFGGPAVLFPLLYRLKDKQQLSAVFSEEFYLVSELFLIPSHMTAKFILHDDLCEFVRMLLEEVAAKVEVDAALVRCVIRMVENLEWSKEARHRAFFVLLHSFRFWAKLEWEMQKDVIVNTYRILPSICTDTDPSPLRSALSLLRTYFSTSRPVVDKEQLPAKREFIWNLVTSHIAKQQAMTDQDMGVIIENLMFTYTFSRDDLPDLVRITRFLLEKIPLKLSDETKESFNKAAMFLLRKCGEKGLPGLQADLLNAIREFYLSGKGLLTPVSTIQKQFSRMISSAGEAVSVFRFKSESSLFEILNCVLPPCLSQAVYFSLLQTLLGGTQADISFSQIRYPQVLDLITNRLSSSPCACRVYQDLRLLCDAHPVEVIYRRENFPAWLLQLFVYSDGNEAETDRESRDLLFELSKSLFAKGILSLKNSGKELRSFVFTLAAKTDKKFAVLFRVLRGVLEAVERTMATGHIASVKKDVYYNLHDFAYLLEDLCEISPAFSSDPNYPLLVAQLLEQCKVFKLCMSSYPPFPLLTTTQTMEMMAGALRLSAEIAESVRLREGGMMRSLFALILRGLTNSRSELPSVLLRGLTFLLNGGSEQTSLSAFSAANKLTCETVLQDDSSFRFLSLFSISPTQAAVLSNVLLEPNGDLLYSDQFLTLYVLTYMTEAIYERVEKGIDCLVLGTVVRELMKRYNLAQFLNAVVARETEDSMKEIKEFHRRHPQLFPSLAGANSSLSSVFSRLEAFITESSDDTIELKNFQTQVRSLTLDLSKATNGSTEEVINILLKEEWRERVHSYLVVQTLSKLLTLTKAVSSFSQAGEVLFRVLEPSGELVLRVNGEMKAWKMELIGKILAMEKEKDRKETLERLHTKRRWRKWLKTLSTPTSGLWSSDSSLFPSGFFRLVNRFDRENRHFLLQPDPTGSSHSDAINRKHLRELEQSPVKRRTITSIDPDDPEQREMLRSFPSLPENTDELVKVNTGVEGSLGTDGEIATSEALPTQAEEETRMEIDAIPQQDTIEDSQGVSFLIPESKSQGKVYDCERICLKGAVFGKLELTNNFVLFKSTKEMKPPGVYFGSALECSQVALESELVWDVREIIEVFSRRFHHVYTAVEMFVSSGKGYYFNCFSEERRAEVLQYFKQFHRVKVYSEPKRDFRLGNFTRDWQRGALSNYEYLTVLNKFASRSYNDLNQYPVFPWVLKDYSSEKLNLCNQDVYRDLSTPIGAIHPDGLRECARRYALWTEDAIMKPFHFGSHYSSEGIILHYMLRMEPYASKAIQLQDGTFDVADRLFFSIRSAYEGSTKSSGDVKELIPEFFYLPEMLENKNNYELGKRQAGETVSDVELPKWAKSPYDFIRQHRKALESLYVSDNLNSWIDLIFGYKQWGDPAVAAHNVFFCFTYEQHVVPLLKSTADLASMEGVIQQIGQFGQTPVQLFDYKHERRQVSPVVSTFFDRLQREGSVELVPYGALVDPEADAKVVAVFALRSRFLIVQDNMTLKIVKWRQGSMENNKPEPSRSQGESEQLLEHAFPYCGDLPRSPAAYFLVWPYLISGLHWDNTVKVHEFETGKLLASMGHHLDIVTCVGYNMGVLVTGSLDTTLAVWELHSSKSQHLLIDSCPSLTLLGHCCGVKQCQVSASQRLVASLGLDSTVLLHSLYDGLVLQRIASGEELSTTLIALSVLSTIACCSREQKSVRIFSCNGKLISQSAANEAVTNAKQMFFSATGEHLTVMCNTAILVWNAYAMEEETEIVLEHVPAAVSLTLEDQNLVGINQTGNFFRIDAETRRSRLAIFEPKVFDI